MEILSWVTLQVILPFSPAVVQKLTIKLKDKRHCFRFFFLEIKPKDCSGRMENSSRQTENSSYPFPLCSAKRLFKISSSYIKLIFLFVKTRILNQDQSLISPDKDTFASSLFCGWYSSKISITSEIFTS